MKYLDAAEAELRERTALELHSLEAAAAAEAHDSEPRERQDHLVQQHSGNGRG